jgi:hypothetical protein
MSVITETDIANRALQRCGALRIADGALRTEDTKNANEVKACYDMLRRAEMRRNVWRFSIRTTALRAIDDDSKLVAFGTWATTVTYAVNDVVTGPDGLVYSSRAGTNIAHDPTTSPTWWTLYFGPVIASVFDETLSYYAGELVYADTDADAYAGGTTYALGDLVSSSGIFYRSLSAGNLGHTPVSSPTYWAVYSDTTVFLSLSNDNDTAPGGATWLDMTTAATVSDLNFIYPIGAGPGSNTTTRNAYRVPNGFLREAPQDPKAGANTYLGGPGGLYYTDWNFEGDYFTTRDSGVIPFRFAADINDPSLFDPLFAEGFSCRLALEVCEPITQSNAKIQTIAGEYKKFMTEARTVNGIETGAVQPPEDSYITVRG